MTEGIRILYSDLKANELTEADICQALTVKTIAAVTLTGISDDTHAWHASQRRPGTEKLLQRLARIPIDTPVDFKKVKRGIIYKKGKPVETVKIKSVSQEQAFLSKHADEMAFITYRGEGSVPIPNLTITLPAWAIGINQIVAAQGEMKDKEIEAVISELGWVVGLIGMLAKGLNINEICAKFQKFESEFKLNYDNAVPRIKKMHSKGFQLILPKRGWFSAKNGFRTLDTVIQNVPIFTRLNFESEPLNRIWNKIAHIYEPNNIDRLHLPEQTLGEISEPASIQINDASIAFLLPSLHEERIWTCVEAGLSKDAIVRMITDPALENRFAARFITLYPRENPVSIDYYPLKRYKAAPPNMSDPKKYLTD